MNPTARAKMSTRLSKGECVDRLFTVYGEEDENEAVGNHADGVNTLKQKN
jgi:hypothetical protein